MKNIDPIKFLLLPMLVSIVLITVVFLGFDGMETYFKELLDGLKNNKSQFTVVSFLALSSDIVLPVPSSLVMYLNGAVLGVFGGMVLSFASSFLAAFVGYFIGKFSALGFSIEKNSKAAAVMQRYSVFAIIITRGIPILSESICLTAGFNRMNLKLYLLLNAIGYLPICIIYAWFGSMALDFNLFLLSFICSILLSLALWVFGRKMMAGWAVEEAA